MIKSAHMAKPEEVRAKAPKTLYSSAAFPVHPWDVSVSSSPFTLFFLIGSIGDFPAFSVLAVSSRGPMLVP